VQKSQDIFLEFFPAIFVIMQAIDFKGFYKLVKK